MTVVLPEQINKAQQRTKQEIWNQFLVDLRSWELHRLFNLGELHFYDQYMNGTMPLLDIFVLICVEGDEFKGKK